MKDKIENGSHIRFDAQYEDRTIYTVSDFNGQRGLAGDKDGRGYRFHISQIHLVKSKTNNQ